MRLKSKFIPVQLAHEARENNMHILDYLLMVRNAQFHIESIPREFTTWFWYTKNEPGMYKIADKPITYHRTHHFEVNGQKMWYNDGLAKKMEEFEKGKRY